MEKDKFIKIYSKALPSDICKYFIDFFEKEHEKGNTWKGVAGGGLKEKNKECTDLTLRWNQIEYEPYDSIEHLNVLSKYDDIVDEKILEYAKELDPFRESIWYDMNKIPLPQLGAPLMHRYEPPNQGYHKYHTDWATRDGMSSYRMLVAMIYLNNVEEGGETEFYHQKIKIKPEEGTLVIFPTYFTHLHRGNKPISNTKYIVNKWALPK